MNEADFRQRILAEIDSVFRLACHLTRSRQEADDTVQETYLRALRSSHTFVLGSLGVRPWLFKVLHNVIATRGAKSQREREVLNDHVNTLSSTVGESACPDDANVKTINWDSVDERLKLAIAELSPPFRTAFLLSAVEGLKYQEIADVTDAPLGTVMSRLSRARAALMSRLAELGAEHGFDRSRKRVLPELPPHS